MAQDAPLSLSEPPAAHRLRVRAAYASLAVATVLIAAKLVVWISTESVALLSSLVDSFVDAAASLVNFFAVRQAIVPADREHRFGHGKAEPLAALGQSAFLVGSAVLLMFEAVRRLVSPAPAAGGASRGCSPARGGSTARPASTGLFSVPLYYPSFGSAKRLLIGRVAMTP